MATVDFFNIIVGIVGTICIHYVKYIIICYNSCMIIFTSALETSKAYGL